MKPPQREEPGRALLLGEDETRYGAYRLEVLPSARVACALSVGADPESPALAHKGLVGAPNEDGLLVIEQGDSVLLAVADAHYGSFSSHALLRRLGEVLEEVPASPSELLRALRAAAEVEPGSAPASETTLLLAVLRRDMEGGFGFSYGDSTCTAVGGRHWGEAFNRHSNNYVSPAVPRSLSPERAAFFEFDVRPGALVLAFTDGVDGCHYRHPRTSLGPAEYMAIFEETGVEAEAYAKRLTEAALEGLPGHPGGQDNVALVVAEA